MMTTHRMPGTAFAVGGLLELCGLFALLVFVAYVAGVLRRLEGDEGWLMLALWTAALDAVLIRRARDPRERAAGRKIAVAS